MSDTRDLKHASDQDDTLDPHPHRSRSTRHRQSMLRVQCVVCGRWFSQTLDGGRPRRHKCVPTRGDS